MNRRDFLKGAIILPNLFSLLPVLAKTSSPPPAIAQPFGFPDSDWLVVLERWEHTFGVGRGFGKQTAIRYSGNAPALLELADRIASQTGKSERISFLTTENVEEILDESGNVAAMVCHDWSKLDVHLDGIWHCTPGLVPRGETGLLDMHFHNG